METQELILEQVEDGAGIDIADVSLEYLGKYSQSHSEGAVVRVE